MLEIFAFQRRLSQRLLIWSFASIGAGIWLMRKDKPDQRSFGQQAAVWGLIDAIIALSGWYAARKRSRTPDAQSAEVQAQETRNLRRLLWINAGLDVLYVVGGFFWAQRTDTERRGWAGHGWGVVVQGVFLFAFDLVHALRLGATRTATVKDNRV